jgi:hypothetical protein
MRKKVPVNIYPESIAYWDMDNIYVVCATDALCGPRGFQHNLTLCCIEMHLLWKISCFTWISWQAFFTHCCNTSKSLNSAEYTNVFRCPHSQKSRGLRSGYHADQLTGSLHPMHFSWSVWFRCCLTVQRKQGDVPSFVNHMCWCCWRRGTCSRSTGKSFTKKRWYASTVSLLGKTTGPKNWSPKRPTQILTFSYLSRHWFLDICWLGLFCSFEWVLYPLKTCNLFSLTSLHEMRKIWIVLNNTACAVRLCNACFVCKWFLDFAVLSALYHIMPPLCLIGFLFSAVLCLFFYFVLALILS